ncbi:coniferyl-alcohol dehydrogenase [Amorphus sp. 3PC139-8]|uniref:coniferyl-alcohol dehydrogenase n=1 Tax=Amorphus sp. 3PC139-8 TaxID=2735676 RepID=UPI00345DC92C
MKLNGKTIVITGVSSGMGAEVARLVRFEGAQVIGMDRNPPMISVDGFVEVDMGNPASIDAAVKELPDRFEGLCNAAGIPGTSPKDDVAKINYLGLRHLTEAVVDRLVPGAGIINFASILGGEWQTRLDRHKALAATNDFASGWAWLEANPVPQETCYQYFKEALIVWTYIKSQAWFLEKDIRMNSIAPGPVFTPILDDFVIMVGADRVEADAAKMKRPGYADEIAPVVSFLLSDEARWVSGVNLPIDGGLASTYV